MQQILATVRTGLENQTAAAVLVVAVACALGAVFGLVQGILNHVARQQPTLLDRLGLEGTVRAGDSVGAIYNARIGRPSGSAVPRG